MNARPTQLSRSLLRRLHVEAIAARNSELARTCRSAMDGDVEAMVQCVRMLDMLPQEVA